MKIRPVNMVGAFATLCMLILPYDIFAESFAITSKEFKLLPPFCQWLNEASGAAPPQGMPYSRNFCYGLKFVLRANLSLGNDYKERRDLGDATKQFEYVLSHTKPENTVGQYNKYLSMACIEKARVLMRLDETTESIKLFQQAIQYNPKLPQAYAGLSDIYKNQGMNDEARKILELGLKRVPKSKSLRRRLDKL